MRLEEDVGAVLLDDLIVFDRALNDQEHEKESRSAGSGRTGHDAGRLACSGP